MATHSLDALLRALGGGRLAPAYYLFGPEDILKGEAVDAILQRALDPALRDFNLDQRSAAALDPEEVGSLCQTLPMLAERRVVLIRDVEAWKRKTRARSAMLHYLEHPAPETLVILIQGSPAEDEDRDLARAAYAVRLAPLAPEQAAEWLLRQAAALGVTLEPAAAEHLMRSVSADLATLASELQKLAALPAGDPLTAERVGELVGIRHGETLFDWRDAVLGDETARAAALLGPVLDQSGVAGVKLATLLGTTLIGVGLTRAGFDRRLRGRALVDLAIRALLKGRPFGLLSYKEEAPRWAGWAQQWPAARVRAGLRLVLTADRALKSTTISDERGILTDLVLRLAAERAEAA